MSDYCILCGKSVKEEYDYCIYCGKPIVHETPKKEKKEVETEDLHEKKSVYILNSDQRYLFLRKVLPTLLIGSIIWLLSEIGFSLIFSETQFMGIFLIFYVSMAILEVILFLLLYFVAKANFVPLGLLVFFSLSLIAGILSIPIILFTQFLPQVHMFVSLSVGANGIVYLMGISLRNK